MISDEILLWMHEGLLKARLFEQKIDEMYKMGKVPGLVHLYIGQEAVAVGTVSCLREDDYLVPHHRGHPLALLKGVPLYKVAAEIFGKADGCCRGRGGAARLTYMDKKLVSPSGTLGTCFPLAAGIGFTLKYKKSDNVVACMFGDGTANTGDFHEALNLASLWKLPVVYVCDNNMYAISTNVLRSTCVNDISVRAAGYNIPGVTVDGMDTIAVHEAVHEAVKRARKGEGPTLIECKSYRYLGHHPGDVDTTIYRSREEVEEWKKRDPIQRLQKTLLQKNLLTEERIKQIESRIKSEIEDAVMNALQSHDPTPDELGKYLYV